MTGSESSSAPRFAIFRKGDAIDFEASGIMSHHPPSEIELAGSKQVIENGILAGAQNELVFSAPGFSLARIWFKSSFPLPRHSHNVACLYYILGGSLRIGTEELAKGDGFFVGAGTPYAYTPGEDGVELLEFRAANAFDIKMFANNPVFWKQAADTVAAKNADWQDEPRPTE